LTSALVGGEDYVRVLIKNLEILLEARKETGLEVNTGKTKYRSK
jgi:hypothetical protein